MANASAAGEVGGTPGIEVAVNDGSVTPAPGSQVAAKDVASVELASALVLRWVKVVALLSCLTLLLACGALVSAVIAANKAGKSDVTSAKAEVPATVTGASTSCGEDSTGALIMLNLDLGLGSVDVPWTQSAGGKSPDLSLPNFTDSLKPIGGKLCPECMPADVDDSYVLAWALNLIAKSDPRLRLLLASQTFGNTDFTSATYCGRRLMQLKGWTQLSETPRHYVYSLSGNLKATLRMPLGSSARAVIDPVIPKRKYIDVGSGLGELTEELAFDSSYCINDAVMEMAEQLQFATKAVTIVATGPLQDISCLVRNYPQHLWKLKSVNILAGREWGNGMALTNGTSSLPGLSDYNVRMNPYAVDLLLQQNLSPEQITFFPFEISSNIATTLTTADISAKGGPPEHRGNKAWRYIVSNSWLRAEWYDRVFKFGSRIWPWDCLPFYQAIEPSSMSCRIAEAKMVWCESAPGYDRYQAPNNSCADHGKSIASLSLEAAQLFLRNASDPPTGAGRLVTVCDAWASTASRDAFLAEMMREVFY